MVGGSNPSSAKRIILFMLEKRDFLLLTAKLVSLTMRDGKKAKASVLINKVFLELHSLGYSAKKIFLLALNNLKPLVENRRTKIRGKLFLVPFPLTTKRQLSTALRILINSSKVKRKLSIKKLANEIILAFKNEGEAIRRTSEIHLTARKNRLYSNYRW
jgi:small subunit ribosomal protein S7